MELLKTQEKIAYGLGDLSSNLIFSAVSTFIMYFYTDVVGIGAAVVGTLLFVSRIFDAVSDPIMGMIADRTTTKWGKFRPYIIFGAIPLSILAVATFSAPDLSSQGKVVYAYASYILLMICYTIVNIPYSSLPTVMTPISAQRAQLASYRMGFAFFGLLLVSAVTLPLVKLLGGDDEKAGFQYVMMIIASISFILYVVTYLGTKERVQEQAPSESASFKEDFAVVRTNRAWIIQLLVGTLFFSLSFMPLSTGMYFFTYNVGNADLATGFFISGGVGMMIGAICSGLLSQRVCKRKLLMFSLALYGLFVVNFYWIDPSNIYVIYLLMFCCMFSMGVGSPMLWAMAADTADYIEWKKRRRVIGLTISSLTFAHKFGMGLGGMLAGIVFSVFGYQAGEAQTEQALFGILLMMSVLPAIGSIISVIILRWYPISQTVCDQMQVELAELRAKDLATIHQPKKSDDKNPTEIKISAS